MLVAIFVSGTVFGAAAYWCALRMRDSDTIALISAVVAGATHKQTVPTHVDQVPVKKRAANA